MTKEEAKNLIYANCKHSPEIDEAFNVLMDGAFVPWDSNLKTKEVRKIMEPTISLHLAGATILSCEEYACEETRPWRWRPDIIKPECDWWLRTPGFLQMYPAIATADGFVDDKNSNPGKRLGVRPVLKVENLKSSGLEIGDSFILDAASGKTYHFTVISDLLAISNEIVGRCGFCTKEFARNRNYHEDLYEGSDIQKFVEDWYASL